MVEASVIVPIYRDWGYIPTLLDCLASQTFQDFEVILIDNGDPPASLPEVPSALSGRVHIGRCDTPGSYAARNLGAGMAKGAIFAFTDADCRPAREWLGALVSVGGALRAGPVRIVPKAGANRWAIFDTVRGMPQDRFVTRNYAVTANLAVPADVFRTLGGFDGNRLSGGDAEFCRRAVGLGYGLAYVPEAIIFHPARDSREAVETKARRIKGGQIASGPMSRRVIWTFRSLVPPVREISAYVVSPFPARWRLIASAVRMQLWLCELHEVVRLLLGGARERR